MEVSKIVVIIDTDAVKNYGKHIETNGEGVTYTNYSDGITTTNVGRRNTSDLGVNFIETENQAIASNIALKDAKYDTTNYSTTIELYDLVPKYFYGDQKILRKSNKLDILVREFTHRKQLMEVQITPAQILDNNNKTKFFYPSYREEIIEDILRKFTIDKQKNTIR
jgi:hypothetical protein